MFEMIIDNCADGDDDDDEDELLMMRMNY